MQELSSTANLFWRESCLNPEVNGHLITISNSVPKSPGVKYCPNFARVRIAICILREQYEELKGQESDGHIMRRSAGHVIELGTDEIMALNSATC